MINEEIKESAKAIQEIAKTTNTGIEVVERLGSFVSRIIKEPLDEASGMITDRLKYARWERQQRLIERANKYIEEKKIEKELRAVPPKVALPIIENASLEDNNELQDIWAYFLASAVDPNFDGGLRTAYIDIIKQLEVIDVHILNYMYEHYCQKCTEANERRKVRRENVEIQLNKKVSYYYDGSAFPLEQFEIIQKLQISDLTVFRESIDNLMRVKCVASFIEDGKTGVVRSNEGEAVFTHYIENDTTRTAYSSNRDYKIVYITTLGINFAKACIPKNQN
jgi:hypothetical protein